MTHAGSGAKGKSWVLSCTSGGYSKSTFKVYPVSPSVSMFSQSILSKSRGSTHLKSPHGSLCLSAPPYKLFSSQYAIDVSSSASRWCLFTKVIPPLIPCSKNSYISTSVRRSTLHERKAAEKVNCGNVMKLAASSEYNERILLRKFP